MGATRRTCLAGSRWALGLGLVVAAMAGGCSDQQATGTHAVESPEVRKSREDSIKEAMQKGSYGAKYQGKAAPTK